MSYQKQISNFIYNNDYLSENMRADSNKLGLYGRTILALEEFNRLSSMLQYASDVEYTHYVVIRKQDVVRQSGEKTTYTTIYYADYLHDATDEFNNDNPKYPTIKKSLYRVSPKAKRLLNKIM